MVGSKQPEAVKQPTAVRVSSRYLVFYLALFWPWCSLLGQQTPAPSTPESPALACAAELPQDQVRVRLIAANVVDRSWDFTPGEPYLEYYEPAFAFWGTPKYYAASGVIGQQPNPFLFRAEARVCLPAGQYQLLLRAKNAARLYVDGQLLAETPWMNRNASGHEPVPELIEPKVPGMWLCPPSYSEVITQEVTFDGRDHSVCVDAVVGGKGLRPELGELVVAWRRPDRPEEGFFLLTPSGRVIGFTESNRGPWLREAEARRSQVEARQRRQLASLQSAYWSERHELARRLTLDPAFLPVSVPDNVPDTEVVDFLLEREAEPERLGPQLSDTAFVRRIYLDLVGTVPTEPELDAFWTQPASERRLWLIERLLDDPRWADSWVPFWQDLLAENPGILKPEQNNTGPFRFWIHESFLDNKPLDWFVTELILMEGGKYEGGPAGFAMATQNDVPMAAKAHVIAQAFLAVDLRCARCHDSPLQPYRQRDLFELAAMLEGKPIQVPPSSSVPAGPAGRTAAVEVTLHAGDIVEPRWPWAVPRGLEVTLQDKAHLREQFAQLVTAPANERFAQVFVNRVWHRYMGWPLVEPLDDWMSPKNGHPELLNFLARDFLRHGYDIKHLVKRIVASRAYQRRSADSIEEARKQAAPLLRRMSAEQLLDSMFVAVGKSFNAEELTMDLEGRRPYDTFLNLGTPQRAWQLAALANERDRPALAMPVAQTLVDLLTAFGWRDGRPHPLSQRDRSAELLQPLTLANGLAVHRAVRISEDSGLEDVCLEAKTPQELARRLFRRTLSREPTQEELTAVGQFLAAGFQDRATGLPARPLPYDRRLPQRVSWSNHLSPEATRLKMQWEELVRLGEPPTARLESRWRERCEDVLWALFNSPEFQFLP